MQVDVNIYKIVWKWTWTS